MIETNERGAIRRLMRQRRRALDATQMHAAARRLRDHLLAFPRFRQARGIAAYVAVQNEISLAPAIEAAWSIGIPVYLPRLRADHMEFLRHEPNAQLRPNRFGIPEPKPPAQRINPRFLDIVLTPLVAFDDAGGRLGTGGGFYDRTFGFIRERRHWRRPVLIGVGYEFQRVPALPLATWDVPLHAVVTDAAVRRFTT